LLRIRNFLKFVFSFARCPEALKNATPRRITREDYKMTQPAITPKELPVNKRMSKKHGH